ncbi:uncharacterized protein LOC111359920 [Spodoptera litura]|uniref:Uncharacterized protein LOC111359920 n=1 Tax=Spodoptera litura TaxID=69820 RepID=A0A9J7EIA1_SPOLT|nr:uncharacterized protein LOC111359920 [Spodoptera litura]
MEFDTEKFISEIQSRPVIWNTRLPEYSDRSVRRKAWEEMVHIYHGTKLTKQQKNNLGVNMQRKWRNIRDSFVKAHKAKQSKNGSRANRKSAYVFYDNLLFLKDTETLNNTTGHVTTENEDSNTAVQNEETLLSTTARPPSPKRSKKNNRDDNISREFVGASSRNLERNIIDDEGDRLFFLSLLKEFKKIPEHMQMQSKIDILKVLKDAQNIDYPSPNSFRGHQTSHYSDNSPYHRTNVSEVERGNTPHEYQRAQSSEINIYMQPPAQSMEFKQETNVKSPISSLSENSHQESDYLELFNSVTDDDT